MYKLNSNSQQELHIKKLYKERLTNVNPFTFISQRAISEQVHNATLGDQRYLLELLQNADDAASSLNLKITITQTGSYLIFSHNGQSFSRTDVEKICDYASKDNDKSGNNQKIGYKGTGFKSVFKISKWVYIRSEGYTFRFDQAEIYKDYPEYPWQLIPIWTSDEELPDEVKNNIKSLTDTTFIIKANPTVNLQQQLDTILDNLQVILFLPNVAIINVNREGQLPEQIKNIKDRVTSGNNTMLRQDLYVNDQIKESWLNKTFPIQMDSMRPFLPTDEHECPKRLREAGEIAFTLAVKIENERITPVASGKLYCFFPTTVSTSLPVVVNTQFLLNSERTQIVANPWNKKLVQLIPEAMCCWMAALAMNNTYRSQILNLLPPDNFGYERSFNLSYQQGQQDALKNIAFIPTASGQLVKLHEVWIDETGFYHEFPDLQQTINVQNKLAVSDLSDTHRIKMKLNGRTVDVNRLALELPKLLKEKTLPPEKKLAIIRYVFTKFNNDAMVFRNSAIIYTISGEFGSAKEGLYLYPRNTLILQGLKISLMPEDLKKFIHPDYFTSEPDLTNYEKFLVGMGVKKFEDIEIVRLIAKYIQLGSSINDLNQLANITKFIFDNQHKLTDQDWCKLRNIEVVVKSDGNHLEKCHTYKAWLATEYQPALDIEKLNYARSKFIHPAYIKLGGEVTQWASFFRKLGVADGIEIKTLDNIEINKIADLFPQLGREYVDCVKETHTVQTATIKNFIYFRFEVLDLAFQYEDIFHKLICCLNDQFYRLRDNRQELFSGKRVSDPIVLDFSIIQYFFKHHQVLCTNKGRNLSTECYSIVNQNELLHAFGQPILDPQINLSDDAKRYLGIHTEFSADEYFQFLENISSADHTDIITVSNTYLQLFQAILSSSPALIGEFDKLTKKLKNWNGRLPTENSDFKLKNELFGFALKEIEIGNSACWFKKYSIFNEADMHRLYKLFNLVIIAEKDVVFAFKHAMIDDQIKQDVLCSLDYISAVEATLTNQNGQLLRNIFAEKIDQLRFYRAENIALILKDKNVELQQLVFACDDHSMYLKFGLNPLTFNEFCNSLSKYLELSKKTQEIFKMVLSFKDDQYICEYLQHQGYNLEHLKQIMQQPIMLNYQSSASNVSNNNPPLSSPIKKLDEPMPKEINFNLAPFNTIMHPLSGKI